MTNPSPQDRDRPPVVWLTDIHLNFLSRQQIVELSERVSVHQPRVILLGGDIGEADSVVSSLDTLSSTWDCPIYFVLGNHDFYRGSIAKVRRAVQELAAVNSRLTYLSVAESPLPLSTSVGLIGHDGWADARVGDYASSLIMMNDYRLIEELRDRDKQSRLTELRRLGDEAGAFIEARLRQAVEQFEHIVLLTHVPPYREACWYEGRLSDDEWAPHFTCLAIGEAIRVVMKKAPQKRLTVLCGHTHGEGTCQPLPNVTVLTGAAEYGSVKVTGVFDW